MGKEKVTVREILDIGAGKTKTFLLKTSKGLHSAASLAIYANNVHPREDVGKYSCIKNYENNTITITAIKK